MVNLHGAFAFRAKEKAKLHERNGELAGFFLLWGYFVLRFEILPVLESPGGFLGSPCGRQRQ